MGVLRSGAPPSRPRILMVGAFPPPDRKVFGGVLTSCRTLLESSLPARAELTLLDSTQISNPPPPFPRRLALAIRRFCTYLAQFERRPPEAVLLFTSAGAGLVEKGAMAWYARLRGVPALMFPRDGALLDGGDSSPLGRFWVRLAFMGARTILCQGPAWKRFAVEELGFRPENAPVVPSWSATPALLTIGGARQYDTVDRPVRLLFMGWLEREKGVFELLEACRQLDGSCRFELNIVGEGNASRAAREFVRRNHMDSAVRFSGWMERLGVEKAMSEADVFVLPSWAEGLPNAMIEAMAAGLAVVVSAVGNIPDVVRAGTEALLVGPEDVPALREALKKVIDDPSLRRNLGEAGYSLAARQFTVEQAADRILQAVNEVVSAPSRSMRE